MSNLEAIILGIIQGITEFLPISSSGHLIIARKIFEINIVTSLIEVTLHAGTLVSILYYFKDDITKEFQKIVNGEFEYLKYIILGTIPAALIGLFFKVHIENMFFNINSINYLIFNYFILSIILLAIKFCSYSNLNHLNYKIAIFIGIAQSIAILPGISRSGLTICIALFLGLNKKIATKFSFILAIPILFFATINSISSNYNIILNDNKLIESLFLGFIFSALTGYVVIKLMVNMINNEKFWYFSIYCFCISLLLLVYNYGL
ncbi:MAG: hypothetical protein CMG64_04510 [Candidatus Marinimicrobia bacterium]|nr:hypothetical protein [Candidatus Neomarinimicrobiota bacterium]|tara:strand:+ start:2154 stop:2942 length:789 start_codon:yes stop_codon:yes gene_type:complete